jgi:hypothetical protein
MRCGQVIKIASSSPWDSGVVGTDTENYHRAYRTNLNRRDLTDGTKREVVKQYLLEHPDRVAEDTQADIAADLGVSRRLIGYAIEELGENGKLGTLSELSTEEKRAEVRAYVEANPTASDREVAREVGAAATPGYRCRPRCPPRRRGPPVANRRPRGTGGSRLLDHPQSYCHRSYRLRGAEAE